MELTKLKLEKFKNIRAVNFPEAFAVPLEMIAGQPDVLIYYIDTMTDVEKFVALCHNLKLPKENRTIMVYAKGRKDGINRDSIFFPFAEGKYSGFRLRAPMLCSLSDKLSACVMSLDI